MQGPKQDIYLCKSKYFHFKYCMLGYGRQYSNTQMKAQMPKYNSFLQLPSTSCEYLPHPCLQVETQVKGNNHAYRDCLQTVLKEDKNHRKHFIHLNAQTNGETKGLPSKAAFVISSSQLKGFTFRSIKNYLFLV